jgi:hypothetical protein
MVGKNNSVMTLAQRKFKNLTHLKCVAHSLDLIAKEAMTAMPVHLEFMIRESYNLFAHSALRQSQYKSLLELVGFSNLGEEDDDFDAPAMEQAGEKRPLKLISPSQTRWLVMADCNERVLSQYDALGAMFEMASVKMKDKTVRDLAHLFKDPANRAMMIFLNPILKDLRRLTKLFQLKQADNLTIYTEIKDFFMDIARRILKNSILRVNRIEDLCKLQITEFTLLDKSDVDFGGAFMRSISRFPVDLQNELKARAMNFLRVILEGLQKRLTETLGVVQSIEPFTISKMKISGLTIQDFKAPFFKVDDESLSVLDNQGRQVLNHIRDYDTPSSL